MGFQTAIRSRQAPAVQGDFASDNPRNLYTAGPGGLVAGASGLTVGRAAWVSPTSIDWDSGASVANNFGNGPITGILPRRLGQALITTFLADNGLLVPQGNPVALLTAGDIWLKNEGTTQAQQGMKAYASLTTGAFSFNWTGTPATASCATATIAAGTAATFTGSITGNILTAGTVTNTVYPGAILTGGSGIPTGCYVVSQLTGTAGAAGTYVVSAPELTVASASLTATQSVFTQGTVTGTALAVGGVITTGTAATGTIIGMSIMAQISAGSGTWSLAPAPGVTAAGTASSGTITVQSNIETKWYAGNSALANELVKAFSQALG